VLSIGKLGAGRAGADYYLRRQAGCELEYYTGAGERAGVWCGAGAAALGLAGELDPAGELVLRELLAGRSPTGEALVRPVPRADPASLLPAAPVLTAIRGAARGRGVDPAGLLAEPKLAGVFAAAAARQERAGRTPVWPAPTIPAEVAGRLLHAAGLDPVSVLRGPGGRDRYTAALARAGGRVDVRLPGLDFTLSAPKSVSVLYGLGSAPVAAQVRAAHAAAVGAALDYLSPTVAVGARGHRGPAGPARTVATQGLIGVGFEHRTSRENDPQLHTHVVVANLARGTDGQWGALDTRAAYRQAQTAGYLYQAVLRGELTRRLGVGWTPVAKGTAEIDGVPAGLLGLFSTRRRAIEAELDRVGRTDPGAARIATLTTRPAKPGTGVSLRAGWAERARAAGYHPDALERVLHRHRPAAPDRRQLADVLLADRGLTARRATFDRGAILRGVCETIPAGAPVDLPALRALATAVVRDPRIVPLLGAVAPADRRYSTAELLGTETAALAAAAELAGAGLATVDQQVAQSETGRSGLSAEQQAMVLALTGSGAGVQLVVGPAGSGKTAALAAAHRLWAQAGIPVRGAALAAIAARVLQTGAGIGSSSVTRLLSPAAQRAGEGIPAGGVLVVDEAGMIGTRQLARLIQLTAERRTKLVLVGDPAQLPEIAAGGLFAALARQGPAITLAGNCRQQHGWERAALAQLRAGDIPAALDAYAARGRLRIGPDIPAAAAQLTADYLAACERSGPGQVLVITSSRADARRWNTVLRTALLDAGRLGPGELIIDVPGGRRSFRAGEQVLITANDYPRGILNGSRGQLTAVDTGQRAVTVRLDDDRSLQLPEDYLRTGRLAHGYALTCHKAQGSTVQVALLWGSAALMRETGYVAMSRGRQANYLYATWEGLRRDGAAGLDWPRTTPAPSAGQRQELARAALTDRLATSSRQQLASSWKPPAAARRLDPHTATTDPPSPSRWEPAQQRRPPGRARQA